jgi:hypothetical protein
MLFINNLYKLESNIRNFQDEKSLQKADVVCSMTVNISKKLKNTFLLLIILAL